MTATVAIQTRPRRVARSVAAVLAGLLANVILSTAVDMLLIAVGVLPPLSEYGQPHSVTDGVLMLALIYRTLFGIFGCYITARLAPGRPMLHSVVLGTIGFVISVVGAITMWDPSHAWYALAIIAVTLPCAWVGGRLVERRAH